MQKYKIHKQAIVETTKIGETTKIWAYVHILSGATIGKNCNICDHCFIENKIIIGDNVTIKCGVYLWDGITIENNVFIGPAVAFTNDRFPRSKNTSYIQQGILLKEGCSIGANATILPGVTIGKYAMIGAGAVVTKNIEDFALVYGNPAKKYGHICSCGKKMIIHDSSSVKCSCGKNYKFIKDKIIECI